MSEFVPIPKTPGRYRAWRPAGNALHVANDNLLPLFRDELALAALNFPIGVLEQTGDLVPVAVLGLLPGKNLFVTREGRWAARYVPAIVRAYPFRMGALPDGSEVVCIDQAALIEAPAAQDQLLYDAEGGPSPQVLEAMAFLGQMSASRKLVQATLQALQNSEVLAPWALSVRLPTGEERQIKGLLCVDEARLNALPDADWVALRASGALAMAYCLLLSMNNLGTLSDLASRPVAGPPAMPPVVEKTPALGETISFGGLLS